MIARYNRASLALGGPGIVLQIAGRIVMEITEDPLISIVAAVATLVGTAILIAGLTLYAKAKGLHPAWGLLGLSSLVGLIALACLKDHAPDGERVTDSGLLRN